MADPKKYWFIQWPNWMTGVPVSWQGWLWLTALFALEIVVTRQLHGLMRIVAFFAVLLGFFLLSRGRTQVMPRGSAPCR